MRLIVLSAIILGSLTGCGDSTASNKHLRYWNEPNVDMPSGYETICGDPDKAPPGSEMGIWAEGPDWCGP